jgi:CheY-like chemotaxis protein
LQDQTLQAFVGHVSQAVHSAQEALSSIESFKPDSMLIDIGLPDMDGYRLVQQLSKSPLGKIYEKLPSLATSNLKTSS